MIEPRSTPDGRGPVLLDDLQCNGNEEMLAQCQMSGNGAHGQHDCDHTDDIGVECT